ncbi:MAG: hypothetical protein WC389_05475 [Lutibacter sp.]|jgi:hypothetical protein
MKKIKAPGNKDKIITIYQEPFSICNPENTSKLLILIPESYTTNLSTWLVEFPNQFKVTSYLHQNIISKNQLQIFFLFM